MNTLKLAEIQHTLVDTIEYVKKADVVALYETILSNQATQFTILISVLCGIVVVLIGATWWWNYNASKKQISAEIDDAKIALQKLMNVHKNAITTELNSYKDDYTEYKGGLQESVNRQIERKVNDEIVLFDKQVRNQFDKIKLQFNNDISESKAEIARIFAVHCDSTQSYENAANWWFVAIEYYSTLNSVKMLRLAINAAKSSLMKIDIDSLDEETLLVCNDNIRTADEMIPDILSDEKQAILKRLNEIKAKVESTSQQSRETEVATSSNAQ